MTEKEILDERVFQAQLRGTLAFLERQVRKTQVRVRRRYKEATTEAAKRRVLRYTGFTAKTLYAKPSEIAPKWFSAYKSLNLLLRKSLEKLP